MPLKRKRFPWTFWSKFAGSMNMSHLWTYCWASSRGMYTGDVFIIAKNWLDVSVLSSFLCRKSILPFLIVLAFVVCFLFSERAAQKLQNKVELTAKTRKIDEKGNKRGFHNFFDIITYIRQKLLKGAVSDWRSCCAQWNFFYPRLPTNDEIIIWEVTNSTLLNGTMWQCMYSRRGL